jgi:hypothetical protein
MTYIPPYEMLKDGIGTSPTGELVVMSTELFRMLLAGVVRAADFDPEWYRNQHPDVAQAITEGEIADELDHFVTFGYQERRTHKRMPVDEAWYCEVYPDIEDAIAEGEQTSAEDHYNDLGYYEGRVAEPAEEHEVSRWRTTIDQSRAALQRAETGVSFVQAEGFLSDEPL